MFAQDSFVLGTISCDIDDLSCLLIFERCGRLAKWLLCRYSSIRKSGQLKCFMSCDLTWNSLTWKLDMPVYNLPTCWLETYVEQDHVVVTCHTVYIIIIIKYLL